MSKITEVQANFDWAETRGKKLVVFMPNYKWPEFTEFSIKNIHTTVDPKDYLIIIGNDNVAVNWEYLWSHNVRCFTLLRDEQGPRNSCFVRNYAIKRCQCDILLNKDCEVVLTGDFIYNAINFHNAWRPGNVFVLDPSQTDELLKLGDPDKFIQDRTPTKRTEMMVAMNSYHAKEIIQLADGKINPSTYYHYAYAVDLKYLHYLGGYDEDYWSYGWEDSDMFVRLFHIGVQPIPDYTCTAIHPYHFRREDCVREKEISMRDVFVQKSPADFFRNKDGWGEGVHV